MSRNFDEELFGALLIERNLHWGRPLKSFDCIQSTNDRALAGFHAGKATGAVWIAREQSQGRGRRGRSWIAPAGEALLLSVLLRSSRSLGQLQGLSLVAGLAARQCVEETLRKSSSKLVRVKWPNDVYVGSKKVAGILVESQKDENGDWGFAVGIGLNVFTKEFPIELPNASSLVLEGAAPEGIQLERLAVSLLANLEEKISRLLTKGLTALLPELRTYDLLVGRVIQVDNLSGIAEGFDAEGRLLLRCPDGQLHALASGTVEWSRS